MMDWSLARAISGLLHDNKADENNEVDTGGVVDEPAEEVDSEAIERLVDSHVNKRASKINHVASEGRNVESQSADRDTNGSDYYLPATSSLPSTHRGKKSQDSTTNHFAMTWSIVVSTCPNWLQRSAKVF